MTPALERGAFSIVAWERSPCSTSVGGPIPAPAIWTIDYAWAGVAQLVEQLSCKQQVNGSIPFAGSKEITCTV